MGNGDCWHCCAGFSVTRRLRWKISAGCTLDRLRGASTLKSRFCRHCRADAVDRLSSCANASLASRPCGLARPWPIGRRPPGRRARGGGVGHDFWRVTAHPAICRNAIGSIGGAGAAWIETTGPQDTGRKTLLRSGATLWAVIQSGTRRSPAHLPVRSCSSGNWPKLSLG